MRKGFCQKKDASLHQVFLFCFFPPQRWECRGCFPGGSKKDLPEHSGRQPGPERSRIGGPAQALCSSGRPANQRSTASERRMRLLMTNTTYSTFSSPLTSPSLHPASSFPDLQGGVNKGDDERRQLHTGTTVCLWFSPLLITFTLTQLRSVSSIMLYLGIGRLSDTGQMYEKAWWPHDVQLTFCCVGQHQECS